MCGIVGFIQSDTTEASRTISAMGASLTHRGPDHFGEWISTLHGVVLGHRRLAILDLSQNGHQPKTSISRRYTLVFNGEIYNYRELKRTLLSKGHSFIGDGDTEVMLAAFEEWGIRNAVQEFVGMFAFGVWDDRDLRLTLVRDRIGEKPLYYGWGKGGVIFGSELKAFHRHPSFSPSVSREALSHLMFRGYIGAPLSIYNGIYKLVPGCLLELSLHDAKVKPAQFSEFPGQCASVVQPRHYWCLDEIVSRRPLEDQRRVEDVVEQLEELLGDVVKSQMVADVPIGAFLSGGVDSSTIVQLMQRYSTQPIHTFSIGFHEAGYDEAPFARRVAALLGTTHTEHYVTPEEALRVVPYLPSMFCEPFGDSSEIPTFLVSKLARERVVVTLSGDGADEIFGGYQRYHDVLNTWRTLSKIPNVLKLALRRLEGFLSPAILDATISLASKRPLTHVRLLSILSRMLRTSQVYKVSSFDSLYFNSIQFWRPEASPVLGPNSVLLPPVHTENRPKDMTLMESMMWFDTLTYLPGDILTKLDRASMAVSLESRAPFVDHRIVEFVWNLPDTLRVNRQTPKYLLRKILGKRLPMELVARGKKGFALPLGRWLRGPLREWAESLLNKDVLIRQGYVNPTVVRKKWEDHLKGAPNCDGTLWNVLMFQAWLESSKI